MASSLDARARFPASPSHTHTALHRSKYNIPTAQYETFTDPASAKAFITQVCMQGGLEGGACWAGLDVACVQPLAGGAAAPAGCLRACPAQQPLHPPALALQCGAPIVVKTSGLAAGGWMV